MATQAFYTWDARGRPYDVATPIEELVSWAQSRGIPILGVIGNNAHLTSNNPQDHTPFSYTAWPVSLPGYIVTACDLGDGDWAYKFIDETRRGLHPWVKYINHRNVQYNFKNGYATYYSSDYHCHVSCRTDHLYTHIDMDPQPVVPQAKGPTMKLIHKLNPVEFALVGDEWHPVTGGQNHANALAKVFGNSTEMTAAEFDHVRSTYNAPTVK